MVFALAAELSRGREGRERRGGARRRLNFASTLALPRRAAQATVLDLSEAGMMIHTGALLAIDETFEVDLLEDEPAACGAEACVVWKRGSLYGCRFVSPVSRGAISAVVLRARAPSREG
jgi:hypothetical protein